MNRLPLTLVLERARMLPLPEGRRSAEVFVDGDLELRFYAPQGRDPQTPHELDGFDIVASGRGKFGVGDQVHPVETGAPLYAAPLEVHRFEDFSEDFAVWVVFYGPVT